MAILDELVKFATTIQENLWFVTGFIACLWAIHIVNFIFRYRLNHLGIVPRTVRGLLGIPFYTFLHGNFNHLFFNSFSLFFLMNLALLEGAAAFYIISIAIIVVSGLAIWLVGKRGVHVGASTLIMGYFGYLIANIWQQPSFLTVILAIVCVWYFGGLFFAVLPSDEKNISWEGHLCGFIVGILVSHYYLLLTPVISSISKTL